MDREVQIVDFAEWQCGMYVLVWNDFWFQDPVPYGGHVEDSRGNLLFSRGVLGGLGNQGGCSPPEVLSRPEIISQLRLMNEAETAYGLVGMQAPVPFDPVARGIVGGGSSRSSADGPKGGIGMAGSRKMNFWGSRLTAHDLSIAQSGNV